MTGLTVCVSNEVVATDDLVASAESATEGRVSVVDTGINAERSSQNNPREKKYVFLRTCRS